MKEARGRTRQVRNNEETETNKTLKSEENNISYVVSRGSYIFTFILLILTLLIYDVIIISQEKAFDLDSVTTDLTNNVYNQSEAVSIIAESLKIMYNHEKSMNIVNFIGTTGVGKTFIANILKKHFKSHAYEVSGFQNGALQHILNKLKFASSTDYSLIVIDDLTVSDVDDVLRFIKDIPQEITTLVVCIFNIQETDNDLNHSINYDHIDVITDKFNKAEIRYNVARFHEFDSNHARAWIQQQLIVKGVNPEYYPKIIKSVLDNQNIRYQGLKGLSSKINLEL